MSHVASIIKHPVPLAKSKMLLGSAAFLLGIVMLTPEARADGKMFFGPQGFESQYHSVSSIQTHGIDDEIVVLRGRLTNYLYKENYEFTDESGATIEVELDDDVDWSYVHKDQLIEIMGEVERNMFKVKIEAKNYRILETSAVSRARNQIDSQVNHLESNYNNLVVSSSDESLMVVSVDKAPVPTSSVDDANSTVNEDINVSLESDNNQQEKTANFLQNLPANDQISLSISTNEHKEDCYTNTSVP